MEIEKINEAIEWLQCLKLRSDISLGEDGYKHIQTLIDFVTTAKDKNKKLDVELHYAEIKILEQAEDIEELQNKEPKITEEEIRTFIYSKMGGVLPKEKEWMLDKLAKDIATLFEKMRGHCQK